MFPFFFLAIEWISSLRMGDFYTYLTFIGIVSVWSIYGLITTVMVTMKNDSKEDS